jgi:hypothetical protein
VEAERVVPPDDVPQQLVVPPVVRRVDDPLLLPRAPRVRADRGEGGAEVVREPVELRSTLAEPLRRLREVLRAPGPDLDLRRDQLAYEVLLEVRPLRGRLQLLEAVRERERRRVEDRELLLDRDGEVAARRVLLVCHPQLLVRRQVLGVAHGRDYSS